MENIIKELTKKYTLKDSIESVRGIVKPNFFRLKIENVIEKFNSVSDNHKTDWNKLLYNVKKSKGILSSLIDGLFGTYKGNNEDFINLNTNEFSPKDVTMVFAATPNKKEQVELAKVIQETLGKNYEVILINSDETSNRDVEEKAKNIVKKAQKNRKKVVFLSKDMGSRSFSISEIDTIILMFDRGSYATISQKIARVLTPGKTYYGEEKTDGYIISLSLDPNREEVNVIDEYVIYEAEKIYNNELSKGVKKVLNSINIFTNGYGIEIEKDLYAERLISSSSLIRLGKASSKPDNIMINNELVTLLTGIVLNESQKEKIERLDGIDSSEVNRFLEGESNKDDSETELKDKKINNIREKILKHMENIVDNIVEISEINNCESDDIIECLDMIKEKGFDEEVVFEVGVNCDTVKQIIQLGGISHKLLNTIITSYNKEENSLLVD